MDKINAMLELISKLDKVICKKCNKELHPTRGDTFILVETEIWCPDCANGRATIA